MIMNPKRPLEVLMIYFCISFSNLDFSCHISVQTGAFLENISNITIKTIWNQWLGVKCNTLYIWSGAAEWATPFVALLCTWMFVARRKLVTWECLALPHGQSEHLNPSIRTSDGRPTLKVPGARAQLTKELAAYTHFPGALRLPLHH
jgi:hypothetical protein